MKSLKGPVGKYIAASSGEKTGQSFQGSYPGRFLFLADAAISIKRKKKKKASPDLPLDAGWRWFSHC